MDNMMDDPSTAIDLARSVVMLMLSVSMPVLLTGMAVGLLISIFQAVTQIQEQTLSFVPKIIVMLLMAVIIAPWASTKLLEFAARMFGELP